MIDTSLIFLLFIILIVAVLVAISILWPYIIGASWTPTSKKALKIMLDMAEVDSADILYDLGSGDGRIVVEACRNYNARAVGIEADPLRVIWSKLVVVVLGLRGRVKIIWGNLFNQDISEATVVTVFLWRTTNQRLKPKLLRELKPGTRVVSYVWTFKGWRPVNMDRKEEVYLYVMGISDKSERTNL